MEFLLGIEMKRRRGEEKRLHMGSREGVFGDLLYHLGSRSGRRRDVRY
jgi:hypothetical protein